MTTVKKGVNNGVSPGTDHPCDTSSGLDGAVGEDREEGVEEEIKTSLLKDPGSPTQEEVDRHYVTHMPFRSWCPVCVQGKARENPHYRKVGKTTSDKPTIGLDYKSFGESINEDDKRTAIVLRDKATVTTHAHAVQRKRHGRPKRCQSDH